LAYILNIETSTTVCSVSVSDKEKVLAFREINFGYTHTENLHVYVKDVLEECRIRMKQLQAVAVSKGPGSYTGLRIGVSAAKGFAWALSVPLIGVDTLQLMTAAAVKQSGEKASFCPMIDARRMEVYTAAYDADLNCRKEVSAMIIDEKSIEDLGEQGTVFFFGDGMYKCRPILEKLPGARFLANIIPSSRIMPELSYKKFIAREFENVAYFEPYYLKEFFVLPKKI
jgi:tRNA threonylcarbamoyladenosine biosynthesis protein TsaB